MLTFEGQKFMGPQQIMQKLTTLPFQACQHRVSSLDAQPSMTGGILVFVTGQLLPEGETNPLKFSQTFHLMPVAGSFVVTNGMLYIRFIYFYFYIHAYSTTHTHTHVIHMQICSD